MFYEMGVTAFSDPKPISNITASVFHSSLFYKSTSPDQLKYRHWKRCRYANEKAMELTDFQCLSGVVFISVKLNANSTNLYYLVVPSGYAKKEIRDRDVLQYGTFAGSFERELVTLAITDYYPYIKNVLYIVSTTTSCIQKVIKLRFLPLLVFFSHSFFMSSDFHSHVQEFHVALSEGHFDLAQHHLQGMRFFVQSLMGSDEKDVELYKQVVLNYTSYG